MLSVGTRPNGLLAHKWTAVERSGCVGPIPRDYAHRVIATRVDKQFAGKRAQIDANGANPARCVVPEHIRSKALIQPGGTDHPNG